MSNEYTWLMSKDKLIVNGVSSDTVGLYVDTPPMPPMPEERIEQTFIHGRAEATVIHTGQYNDITITVTCYVFDYGYEPDLIYKFLSGAQTIAFSSSDNYCWKVKRVLAINPAYQGQGKNAIVVSFQCSPFRYAYLNPENVYETPDGESTLSVNVYNAGSIYCEPVIWLEEGYNHAAAVITVNGIECTVSGTTTGDVFIDLPRMEIYSIVDGEMQSRQSGTYGRWWDFVLPTGYSEITLTGSRKMKLTKNERWL